jgi:hypothetical protein
MSSIVAHRKKEKKRLNEPKAFDDASLGTFQLLFVLTGAVGIEHSSP